jgi:hypothetical protein
MAGAKPYTLRYVSQHPLARMLPLHRYQDQAYRLGERIPPSALDGHGPTWEAVTVALNARSTLQVRVNLQRDFTLIAISASSSSSVNGGFRAQFYDKKKGLRFADRNVNQVNFAGTVAGGSSPVFLREPYRFDLPDSQLLLNVQNLEIVANTVQIVFYGSALRFNEPAGRNFPGGVFTGYDWNLPSQKGQR